MSTFDSRELVGTSDWFDLFDAYRIEYDRLQREVVREGQSLEPLLGESFERLLTAVADAVYSAPDGRDKAMTDMENVLTTFQRILDSGDFVKQVRFQMDAWDQEVVDLKSENRSSYGAGLLSDTTVRVNEVLLGNSQIG